MDQFYKQLKMRQKSIYKSVLDSNVMVYVELQSLIELLCERFLYEKEGHINPNSKNTAYELMNFINEIYIKDINLFKEFLDINSSANRIKHGNFSTFNTGTTMKYFTTYNKIVQKLFSYDNSVFEDYKLDESIFKSEIKIVRDDDKELSNRVISTIQTSLIPKPISRYKPVVKWFTSLSVSVCCGYGKQDNGFEVCGIRNYSEGDILPCLFQHANIYATIFNFLQRSRNIRKSSYIIKYEEDNRKIVNYKNIYRYQMIILSLIRFNYFTNNQIKIRLLDGSPEELELAFNDIQSYAALIADLGKVKFIKPKFEVSTSGETITLSNITRSSDSRITYISDYKTSILNSKDVWYEENIKYSIDNRHKEILEVLLKDFFGFDHFKLGQFESIQAMLNNDENSICILPTGGGKSLIYYFIGLLNPNPIIIISPTNLLIHDQKRNLLKYHNIDDVSSITPDFKGTKLVNKFVYLVPDTLQHYEIISKIINWNVNRKIAYVILDEVHTICNWSHDFRPSYLMLSHNLINYIDNTKIFGFTATANYKVMKDLLLQLNINKRNIISPVEMKRENIIFQFYPASSELECSVLVGKHIQDFVTKDSENKAIVFSKNIEFSNLILKNVSKRIKYEISLFDSNNIYTYEDFIQGNTKVLLADNDFGVGLNIPNVEMILHNGIPISKAQYVQEIGRAGRNGDVSISKVFFKLKTKLSKEEMKLINYDTSIDELIYLINKFSSTNEIASTFKRMFGHIENQQKSSQSIIDIYLKIKDIEKYTSLEFNYVNHDAVEEINRIQKYLYVLFRIGVIKNWFVIKNDKEMGSIKFFIETAEEKDDLNYIKYKISEYLNSIGNYKEIIYQIKQAENINAIIFIYEEWYYEEFIYHHKEQLLNMLNFLQNSIQSKNEDIINELKDYFYLPISNLDEQIYDINKMRISEILINFNSSKLNQYEAAVQRGIENNYNSKFDLYLLLTDLYKRNNFEDSRFLRMISNFENYEKIDLKENINFIYDKCSTNSRIKILNTLFNNEITVELIEKLYQKCDKDIIYYGYLSRIINRRI